MATGKVERWAIVNGKGELHGPYTGPETARDAATDFDKIRPGHAPHRPLLLREVDPAHDAAVARLVEAAKAVADYPEVERHIGAKLHHALNFALSALPAPIAAEPAKGVRCWRRIGGFDKGLRGKQSDRVRETRDGGLETINTDGSVERWTDERAEFAECRVRSGEWVECPDAPYVAPPVAAPSPVAAMESAEAFVKRCLVVPVKISEHDDALVAEIECNIVKELKARLSAAGGVNRESVENLKHEVWVMGYKRGQADAKAGRNIAVLTAPREAGNG